jgi:hypothetical protein
MGVRHQLQQHEPHAWIGDEQKSSAHTGADLLLGITRHSEHPAVDPADPVAPRSLCHHLPGWMPVVPAAGGIGSDVVQRCLGCVLDGRKHF